jgi:hypothetical protein
MSGRQLRRVIQSGGGLQRTSRGGLSHGFGLAAGRDRQRMAGAGRERVAEAVVGTERRVVIDRTAWIFKRGQGLMPRGRRPTGIHDTRVNERQVGSD